MFSLGRLGAPLGAALAATILSAAAAAQAPPEPSIAEVRARADAGDAEAQNDLAGRLAEASDGRPVGDAQLVEAREWYRRASDGGSVEGMNNYATTLLLGIGGPRNEAEGRRLRELAAERGSQAARMSLAERYLGGAEGYPNNPSRAFELMAAESSSPIASYAQWRLGMMHLSGTGTVRNSEEAFRWVVRAADGGEVRAMVSRAVMLATGDGVPEDDVQARRWYERAATSNTVHFAHAMRGLGAMLVTGEGGPADLPRGIAYLRIAQAGNDQNATRLLTQWNDRITPEVNRQAVEIADRWMGEHMPASDD
ncbi:MAG: tetratricopeptide repeat protein [Sphingomonas sp.]